ncbi:signal recognition particle protein [Niveispirillum cyanobacteriorum]|uniref:Signal recognition particle protein n=1 Tax=Niveispirillum cyanobacteriorum TaxID=1612173 RepID=A0A2K9NBW2_9PROT|nr:signal recognition particle protein [Niveispirillum cyanobacteriorum]AUN30608.1 signal recognition particle protein [Niveispirillum cyanobacteriorum]GGE53013.1 signal recognition particle protein [Niveispirillum cyanobacteriorum]
MFDGLTGRLGDIFDRLRKRGALSEDDVNAALREVRIALLEADVALPAVKAFVTGVKEKAVGTEVLRGINPGQMVIKIVHDHLVELLGSQVEDLNFDAVPPVPILMVGLQGSGKTTTSAKIAVRLKNRDKKKVLLASLDTRRPAAQEQLRILGEQTGVASLPIIAGQQPVEIAKRAMEVGRLEGFDVVILDTAGRLAIDEELMAEVVAIRDATKPIESLLVVDAMTGQDAVTVATNFNERVGITGIVMTRIDGDARGGAALSMRHVTGKPIKLMGMGEKTDALEPFHPDRIAGRILGMGDVVSLVEKAAESIDKEEAEKLAKKLEKGGFDLEDMLSQMRQIRKLGGMGGMMNLLPGMGKIKEQLKNANIDEKILDRQEAIILSMTKKERKKPDILNASRRRRIATGAGVTVADVNRLIKQYQDMSEMMKKMKKMGQKGLLRQGLGALMPKGLR